MLHDYQADTVTDSVSADIHGYWSSSVHYVPFMSVAKEVPDQDDDPSGHKAEREAAIIAASRAGGYKRSEGCAEDSLW